MRNRIVTSAAMLAIAALATSASAAIVVDGSLDVDYGPTPLAVQENATGFGNSTNGAILNANGSELDNAYAVVTAAGLHVFLGGNLEGNGNKLELFIDTGAAGQSTLSSFPQGGLNGLIFDSGFTPSYYLTPNISGGTLFVDKAVYDGTSWTGSYLGSNTGSGALGGGGSNPGGVQIAVNNSNTAGVSGSSAAGASTVTTGIEFLIPLAELGLVGAPDGTQIQLTAAINNGGHNFLSNQILSTLPAGTNNLGNPNAVNFSNIAGDQFFTVVVPEPTTLAALAGAGLLALRRRR